jgi:hypothetical protein
MYRDKEFRKHQYFLSPEWPGGKYFSPGLAGSRSGGLLAATWASMVSLGREGYRRYAKAIFETAFAMHKAVTSHPELRLMGKPTWCFSFTSDQFDIYHVNDFMKTRGWRFNGQQYPNAIHMCVTRPQTQPGVVDAFARDLDEAVRYALNPPRETPASGAVYGGAPKGVPEVQKMINDFMVGFLDASQACRTTGVNSDRIGVDARESDRAKGAKMAEAYVLEAVLETDCKFGDSSTPTCTAE